MCTWQQTHWIIAQLIFSSLPLFTISINFLTFQLNALKQLVLVKSRLHNTAVLPLLARQLKFVPCSAFPSNITDPYIGHSVDPSSSPSSSDSPIYPISFPFRTSIVRQHWSKRHHSIVSLPSSQFLTPFHHHITNFGYFSFLSQSRPCGASWWCILQCIARRFPCIT